MLRRLRVPAAQLKNAVAATNQNMPAHTTSFKDEIERLDRMPEGELSRYDWSFAEDKPSRIRAVKK
jgi:hypothetical protein